MKRRALAVGVVCSLVVLGLLVRRAREAPEPPSPSSSRPLAAPPPEPWPPVQGSTRSADLAVAPSDAGARAPSATPALVRARWGSGADELGHRRVSEGNAEGPMSLALAGDDVLLLDQVNGRVVRYDRSGRRLLEHATTGTTQDVAVAADGTTALLDRLVDKKVALVSRDGRRIGELPLPEGAVGEPGLVTGLFVDGKDVYVEKEHGALVRIGTTDGRPGGEPGTLQGRPSKDGTLLVSAELADAPAGLTVVNAFDRRAGALRFARRVSFPKPAHGIVLLDTDARGVIYLGVWAGEGTRAHVACLDPSDGHATGRVEVPLSEVPEESFRDFAVRSDGTIVFAHRTDEGVEIRTATCP